MWRPTLSFASACALHRIVQRLVSGCRMCRCDIWGCSGHDSSTELLLHGQSAKIDLGEDHMAIACNPVRPHIFATASEGPRVYYWNARNRQLVVR